MTTETNLEGPVEAIRVAIALGYEPPVFVGATVYTASVTDSGDGYSGFTEELGVYSTEDGAKTAVRNWVVNRYYEMNEHPLLAASANGGSEAEDYEGITTDALLKEYFAFWTPEQEYDISAVKILGTPAEEI